MMKKYLYIFIIYSIVIFIYGFCYGQHLAQIYKTGTLKLEADPEFGKNTKWENLFSDYNVESYNRPIGTYREMAITDDGTIFVLNYNKSLICKFDKDGKLLTEFGQKGREPGDFFRRPKLGCIVNNRFVLTHENNGRLNLFDFNGNFQNSAQIDYIAKKILPLDGNKVAIAARVPYSRGRTKYIVAIKNLNTGDENYISSKISKRYQEIFTSFKNPEGRNIFHLQKPFSSFDILIGKSENKIITAYSNSPEIIIFSPDGTETNRFTVKDTRKNITLKEIDEYNESIEKVLNTIKNSKTWKFSNEESEDLKNDVRKEYNSPGFFPEFTYYFYNLITDSDGNILIFPYIDEEDTYKFHAYSPDGQFIGETTIDPGIYKIDINDRFQNLIFHKGDLYCLAALKEHSGIPLRLIKVKLTGGN